MPKSILCDPPLGRLSALDLSANAGIQVFTAVLELTEEEYEASPEWNLQLWCGHDGQADWQAVDFALVPEDSMASALYLDEAPKSPPTYRLTFTLELHFTPHATPLNFTIRFRPSSSSSSCSTWSWARDIGGQPDGRLLLPPSLVDFKFTDIFPSPSAKAHMVVESKESKTWDLKAEAREGWSHVALGHMSQVEKWYALVRKSSAWFEPRTGSEKFWVDRDAVLVGWQRKDGLHVALLGGVSADGLVATYITSDSGEVRLKSRSDDTTWRAEREHWAVCCVARTWEDANKGVWERVKGVLGRYVADGEEGKDLLDLEEKLKLKKGDVEGSWYEAWYDGLEYCTWNGLGRELTEERLLDALQAMHSSGLRISTLIIDDNWQSLRNRRWTRFEADSTAFPYGLKHTITEIKRRYPYIRNVLVWHAILGYWEGIDPHGEIAHRYKTMSVRLSDGREIRIVSPEDVRSLYNDFYKFLSGCGVDGVKCDVQSMMDDVEGLKAHANVLKTYQSALKISGLWWFQRKVIYCMEQNPYVLLSSLLPSSFPSAVYRQSDDFFPHIPASHAHHVYTCALNSLYTSHLNGVPSWDMFQTSLPAPYSRLHATARAISGGTITITDLPGEHDITLIEALTMERVQGGGLLACRPEKGASVTDPYMVFGGKDVMRLVAKHGGATVVGVFNLSTDEGREEMLSVGGLLKDAADLEIGTKGMVYPPEVTVGETYIASITTLPSPTEPTASASTVTHEIFSVTPLTLPLPPLGSTTISLVPTLTLPYPTRPSHTFTLAILGLTRKLLPPCAITSMEISRRGLRWGVFVTLRGLGVLSMHVGDLEERWEREGAVMVLVNAMVVGEAYVWVEGKNLFVDVGRAWREGGGGGLGVTEVVVELLFG